MSKKALKITGITIGALAGVAALAVIPYVIQNQFREKKLEEKNQKIEELSKKIADPQVQKNFTTEKKSFQDGFRIAGEEILKKITENKDLIKAIGGEKEKSNISQAYNDGLKILLNIIADIQLNGLEKYNKNTKENKISAGLEFVKNYLSEERLNKIVKGKNGIADFVVDFGKKVGKYAKTIFTTLKENSKTKDLAKLNDLIEAVDKKFDGENNIFTTISLNLKKFNFNDIKELGHRKVFQNLVSIITKAKEDAVKVLDSVGLAEEEIKTIKEIVKPYYQLLSESLDNLISLFRDSLEKLPKVLETLK